VVYHTDKLTIIFFYFVCKSPLLSLKNPPLQVKK
jgi:hypothetical protein